MNIVNEDVIAKILKSCDVDVVEITQLKWDLKSSIIKAGSNYLSEVYRLIIEFMKDKKPQKKVIFIKAPCNSPMYEVGSKWDLFNKELVIYAKVLPKIYTFEEDYFTARYYYSDDKESLFLKDLTQSGYKTGNRIRQLDFEHCAYALKCLAKLHGFSFHLEKTSGLPEVVRKDVFFDVNDLNEEISNQCLEAIRRFCDYIDQTVRLKYLKNIEFFKSLTWKQIVDDMNPQNSSFNVLNHGDYWTNNIMFKYNKYGIIKKAKILDFQIARWANPATDLIYFVITSMRYDVYQEHFDLLCTIYLDTLNKILTKFDYPNYQMAELKKDIASRYKYGLVVLSYFTPVILNDPFDPINIKDVVQNNESDSTALNKMYNMKKYMEVANTWFLHYIQQDITGFESKLKVSNGNILRLKTEYEKKFVK